MMIAIEQKKTILMLLFRMIINELFHIDRNLMAVETSFPKGALLDMRDSF